jgi:hypothetical protein
VEFVVEGKDAGRLPSWLSSPVANSLRVEVADGEAAIVGRTGTTAEYQLVSTPVELSSDVRAVRLLLRGRVLEGSLYAAFMDERGAFLGSIMRFSSGQVRETREIVPVGRHHTVRVLLGNGSPGQPSLWDIRAIGIDRLDASELAASRNALAALLDRPAFDAHEVGGLPWGFTRPVPNDLTVVAAEGSVAVTGLTNQTGDYQLLSVPIPIGPNTEALILSVEGEVLEGALYCAILDERGRFLGPVATCYRGAIHFGEEIVAPDGNRSVGIALGNGAPGEQSRWALHAIRLQQLSAVERRLRLEEYARRLRFEGSAWAWAFRVLRRVGSPSPR